MFHYETCRGWKGPFSRKQMRAWYEKRYFPLFRGDIKNMKVRYANRPFREVQHLSLYLENSSTLDTLQYVIHVLKKCYSNSHSVYLFLLIVRSTTKISSFRSPVHVERDFPLPHSLSLCTDFTNLKLFSLGTGKIRWCSTSMEWCGRFNTRFRRFGSEENNEASEFYEHDVQDTWWAVRFRSALGSTLGPETYVQAPDVSYSSTDHHSSEASHGST